MSDTHGVNINVATFSYFKEADGSELLARVFLLEPSEVELKTRIKGGSKRRPNLTLEELEDLAEEAGVKDLYVHALRTFEKVFWWHRTRSGLAFDAPIEGHRKTVITIRPGESSAESGLRFWLYTRAYREAAKATPEQVETLMPRNRSPQVFFSTPEYEGFEGFITSTDEVDRLAEPLAAARRSMDE